MDAKIGALAGIVKTSSFFILYANTSVKVCTTPAQSLMLLCRTRYGLAYLHIKGSFQRSSQRWAQLVLAALEPSPPIGQIQLKAFTYTSNRGGGRKRFFNASILYCPRVQPSRTPLYNKISPLYKRWKRLSLDPYLTGA